jgi:dihydrodiol dehydrogenase / D-xylose 1-dehydrogenase (NADP)
LQGKPFYEKMDATLLPSIRWGILGRYRLFRFSSSVSTPNYPSGTGWVSTRFAADLLLQRASAPVRHQITALGTSSQAKGTNFVASVFSSASPSALRPKIYTSYSHVYTDPQVDIVYIGTPHSYHKEQCLAAIAAGKHVLCEKPFTINAAEAEEVIVAARAKGVFIMEGAFHFASLFPPS